MKKSWLVLMSLCLFAVCAVVYAQSSTTKEKLSKSGKAATAESSSLNAEVAKALLELKDELELTDKQVEKLNKILQTTESKAKKTSSNETQSQSKIAMCQEKETQSQGRMTMCQEMMKKCQEMMKDQQEAKGCCGMCTMMKK